MALIDTGSTTYLARKDVQTIIRYYFIILWFAIAYLGNYCCRSRSSLKLLSGGRVSIASMTGWLQGFSVLKTAWSLRAIPGGWVGFLMIIAFPLSLLSDIGLNYFLISVSVESECAFGTGLVIDAANANTVPGNQGTAYAWANSAQANANANYGQYLFTDRSGSAIYRKANNDTTFLPRTSADVLGYWNCSFNGDAIPYTGQTDSEIQNDLTSQGLLYGIDSTTIWGIFPALANGSLSEQTASVQTVYMSWSTSEVGQVWDIKAAVDIFDSDPSNNGKTIQPISCVAYDYTPEKEVSTILTRIAINATMPQWMSGLQGYLYPGIDATQPYEYVAFNIEWVLNNLIMVSGGQQSVSHVPAVGADQEQGCYVGGTQITAAAWALMVVVSVITLFFIGYAIYLYIAIRLACKRYDRQHANSGVTAKEIIDNAPGSLLTWMQHASYEGTNTHTHPDTKELKGLNFIALKGQQEKMGIVLSDQPGVDASSLGSTSYTGHAGLGSQKEGYTQVQVTEAR